MERPGRRFADQTNKEQVDRIKELLSTRSQLDQERVTTAEVFERLNEIEVQAVKNNKLLNRWRAIAFFGLLLGISFATYGYEIMTKVSTATQGMIPPPQCEELDLESLQNITTEQQ